MVSTWSRCEVGGEFIRATRLGNKQLPHRIHLCILAHDSSGSLLPPRPSTPPGAIRELRCPSIWLSSIGFRVIGRRIEEWGDEEGYWEAPTDDLLWLADLPVGGAVCSIKERHQTVTHLRLFLSAVILFERDAWISSVIWRRSKITFLNVSVRGLYFQGWEPLL